MITKIMAAFVILFVFMCTMAHATILYHDNFESGNISNWSTVVQSDWPTSFNIVNIDGNNVFDLSGSGSALGGIVTNVNYSIDVDVYIQYGIYPMYAVGILFGSSGVSSMANMDAYMFQGRGNSEFQIEQWSRTYETSYPASTHGMLPLGTWTHMKVDVAGANVSCYANNNLIINSNLAGIQGGFGFRTWGANAYFDNLIVSTPYSGQDTDPVPIPTPEPSTFLLLSAGLVGAGLSRNRQATTNRRGRTNRRGQPLTRDNLPL